MDQNSVEKSQSASSSPSVSIASAIVTAVTASASSAATTKITDVSATLNSSASLKNHTSFQSNSSFQAANSTIMSATDSANTSSSSNSSSTHPGSQSLTPSHNQTSHPGTNTTVSTTTKATKAPDSEPPQCSYNVTKHRSVLKFEVNRPGNYNINVFEGRPKTVEKIQVHNSTQNSVWKTEPLKPCTEYSHNVSFIGADGKEIFCNSQANKTKTDKMSKGDVKEKYCIPEHVCYESDWDLSSSISTPDNLPVKRCSNDSKTFCVRPANKNICSDLTITFTSGACVNSSFNFTKSISVDFLNSNEIQQNKSPGLPAKIETDIPKCKNLSVSYTCSEKGKPDDVKQLSELEPFTDYNCTGRISDNNNTTNKTTPPIHFRVDCDLTINNIMNITTNNSIELSWKTTSKNCKEPKLEKLSYDCICQKNGHKQGQTQGQPLKVTGTKLSPEGGTCRITGLDPYKSYTCQVQPKYNNEIRDATGTKVQLETKIGRPGIVRDLTLTVQDHNTIRVTWVKPQTLNGPEVKYRVHLYKAGDKPQEKETWETNYVFTDLSYSTTYNVKVVAFNQRFESPPTTKKADTLYNDKAVIGFLVFLILVIAFVALFFIAYKIYIKKLRKSRNDVNEDMALEAIYVNARPPGWRHKEAR
ncbi:receptor-type tyrosine-protein phosphatase C-like isoform X1 [Archocentrus centrarchus]|uniref:receptor-type tyrosine-protein phosphatase C-like isoform X1 n=2 Tax=Archocentrus centrarchus TaxID=63155 RepID=UPI0011E9E7A2|nr:receptor-type tyrosine-protein phosphatase C-like isoform X1 [Archocentrus centrarchus]